MLVNFTFRKIDLNKDIDSIYEVICDPVEQYNLNTTINANTKESYQKLLSERLITVYEDFTIIEVEEIFSGFVAAYDLNPQGRHIKALIFITRQYRNGALGLSGIKYMKWLFDNYDIDKVYTEVYSYNVQSIKFHNHFGFIEEGRLFEYRYLCGKYWEQIYYSMTREMFFSKFNSVITRFLK